MSYAIELNDIKKEFSSSKYFIFKKKKVQALRGVTFNVRQGEVFGLLGPNGSGKTTLIRTLCGLVRSTGGSGRVFGMDIRRDTLKIRERIALLPQEASCYENLTARENIYYYGGMYGIQGQELNDRTDELLELIDLKHRAKDLTKEFSGGMKRKVLVARALVTNPDLVFLDEPTTGIDILGARVIRTLVKKLSREFNKTIFLTTHDLAEVGDLCDRVGIMTEGKLVAIGTPDELEEKFKASGLEELFIGLSTGEIDFE